MGEYGPRARQWLCTCGQMGTATAKPGQDPDARGRENFARHIRDERRRDRLAAAQ